MNWLPDSMQMRLVLVLAHFLWQGAVIAAGLSALTALLQVRRAAARYAVTFGAFLMVAACPVVTWFALPEIESSQQHTQAQTMLPNEARDVEVSAVVDVPTDIEPTATTMNGSPSRSVDVSTLPAQGESLPMPVMAALPHVKETQDDASVWWRPAAPWIVGGWLIGVLGLSLRLLSGAALTWSWRWNAAPLPEPLRGLAEQLCERLRMRVPLVRTSARVAEAVAIGLLRPMVLVPAAWVTELPPDMLEAVLAHELAHLRRFDLWVNLFQGIVETLLFYHPAVWWLSRRLRTERELCCDEIAVAVTQDNVRYAEMLELVGRLRLVQGTSPLAMTMGGPKYALLNRVKNVLQPSPRGDVRNGTMAVVLSMSVLSLTLLTSVLPFGQADDEVVSNLSDAGAEKQSFVATLENEQTIELVAVGTHLAKPETWWKANGTPLNERPKVSADRDVPFHRHYADETRQTQCREFVLRATGFSKAATRVAFQWWFDSLPEAARSESLFVGATEFTIGVLPPFERGSKSPQKASLRLGIDSLPDVLVRSFDVKGQKLGEAPTSKEWQQIDNFIQPIAVRESSNETLLLLKMTDRRAAPIVIEEPLVAIDKDGKRHAFKAVGPTSKPMEVEYRFAVPLSQIGRFEYGFRRFRQQITFQDVSLESGSKSDVKVEVISPPPPIKAELPGGLSVEFVGITKNTRPANEGWRADGRAIGDVGYWPSTIVLHGNTTATFVENGPHPEPNAEARDFLFRFRGLKGVARSMDFQSVPTGREGKHGLEGGDRKHGLEAHATKREPPSLCFKLPTRGTSYPHRPLKDPYELRISGDLRGDPSPGAKWTTPDDVVRVGVSDDAWGEWLQVDLTGKVLKPLTAESRYRSHYESIEVVGVKEHERAPNKLALVLKHHQDLKTKVDFQIRGVDANGEDQWLTEWEGYSRPNSLYESNYGLGSAEKQPTVRYEFRLRPYRHWVTFKGVTLEPGKTSAVTVSVESVPSDEGTKTVAALSHGREIELVGIAHAAVGSKDNATRKVAGWWKPDGTKLEGEPFTMVSLPIASQQGSTEKHRFFEFALTTRMSPDAAEQNQPPLAPLVLHGGQWSGSRAGLPLRAESWNQAGIMQHQFLVGFEDDSKPAWIAFYYSDQNAKEGGHMSLDGKLYLPDDAKPRTKQLLESLQLAGIEKSPGQTVVKFKPNGHFRRALQLHVNAVLADGKTVFAEDPSDYERLVFKTAGSEVESLQLNVRPMTHRVDCRDIALRPGQKCNPRVFVTPLDELYSITFRNNGESLGILSEVLPQELATNLKLLQPELNSERGSLIVEVQKQSALEHAERIVKQLEADGWKWPTITLKPIGPIADRGQDGQQFKVEPVDDSTTTNANDIKSPDLESQASARDTLQRLIRGGKINTSTIQEWVTQVARAGAQDLEFARLVLAEFEKANAAEPRSNRLNRVLLSVIAEMFEAWSEPRWKAHLVGRTASALPDIETEFLKSLIKHAYSADRGNIAEFTLAARMLHHAASRDFLRDVLRNPESAPADPFAPAAPRETSPTVTTGNTTQPTVTPTAPQKTVPAAKSKWQDNLGGGWGDAKFIAAVGLAELNDVEGVEWLLSKARDNEFGLDGSLFYNRHVRDPRGSLRASSRASLADLFGLSGEQSFEQLNARWNELKPQFMARPVALMLGTNRPQQVVRANAGDGRRAAPQLDADADVGPAGVPILQAEAATQPQGKEAKTLFAKWARTARGNGNIPGGTLGPLVRVVTNFVKNNPTHEGAPKFAELLKRVDVKRDWSRDEAVKLLDEVSAIYPSLPEWVEVESRFVLSGDVVVGKPLPEELKKAPWGEAQANGLRAAWLLEPVRVPPSGGSSLEHEPTPTSQKTPEGGTPTGGTQTSYHLGTALKSRLLFHNSGKNAVVFRALTWNQGGHKARDAQGAEITVNETYWTTLPMVFVVRLAPGEFLEVVGAGIGVGPHQNDEDWREAHSQVRVGSWIEAKVGDEVTFLPSALDADGREAPQLEGAEKIDAKNWWLAFITNRLSLDAPLPADANERGRLLDRAIRDFFGNAPTADELTAFKNDASPEALDALAKRLAERTGFESFSGLLKSGPTTFKVLPVDPEVAKRPRSAKGPGQYPLGGKATFVVTRRPETKMVGMESQPTGRILNEAHLSLTSPDPTKPLPPHVIPLPDGYDSWSAAWMRNGTVLWVAVQTDEKNGKKNSIRRYDVTNPAAVIETLITDIKSSEQLPQAIIDALRSLTLRVEQAAEQRGREAKLPQTRFQAELGNEKTFGTQLANGTKLEFVGVSLPFRSRTANEVSKWWQADGRVVDPLPQVMDPKTRMITPREYEAGLEVLVRVSGQRAAKANQRAAFYALEVDGRRESLRVPTTEKPLPPMLLTAKRRLADDSPEGVLWHALFMPQAAAKTAQVRIGVGHVASSKTYDDKGQLAHETLAADYPEVWRRFRFLKTSVHAKGLEISTSPERLLGELGRGSITVTAIDGRMFGPTSSQLSADSTEERHRFEKLDANDIDAVTLTVRVIEQWVSFDNVSLGAGDITDAKVSVKTVEHADTPATASTSTLEVNPNISTPSEVPWGPVSNGLRMRVVPVSAGMTSTSRSKTKAASP